MSRAITFTQAKVRRAVRAVASTGLNVRRVTVKPDGSIAVDLGGNVTADNDETATATSWDDV